MIFKLTWFYYSLLYKLSCIKLKTIIIMIKRVQYRLCGLMFMIWMCELLSWPITYVIGSQCLDWYNWQKAIVLWVNYVVLHFRCFDGEHAWNDYGLVPRVLQSSIHLVIVTQLKQNSQPLPHQISVSFIYKLGCF